jgi:hypothetical protein
MGAFEGNDAGICAQRFGELSTPHVESIDARRAAPQQTVGEAASGGTNVETDTAGNIDTERIEGGIELFAAARDETRLRHEGEGHVVRQLLARLVVRPRAVAATHAHPAGEQQSLGLPPVSGQAACHEQVVEPLSLAAAGLQAERFRRWDTVAGASR